MMNKICPICSSKKISKMFWNGYIFKCHSCLLLFNDINIDYDYKSNTKFTQDQELLAKYNKYADRDYKLISDQLCGINCVLEIGSGYGFLSQRITKATPNIKYFHLEVNQQNIDYYIKNGHHVLSELNQSISPDLIIMSHCLEHINNAPNYIRNVLDTYRNSAVILMQTNPYGIIPRFIPWGWYGWALDQHYYHFSICSLRKIFESCNMEASTIKYYKLDQEPSFNLKGIAKSILWLMNKFISGSCCDAYMIKFEPKNKI